MRRRGPAPVSPADGSSGNRFVPDNPIIHESAEIIKPFLKNKSENVFGAAFFRAAKMTALFGKEVDNSAEYRYNCKGIGEKRERNRKWTFQNSF